MVMVDSLLLKLLFRRPEIQVMRVVFYKLLAERIERLFPVY